MRIVMVRKHMLKLGCISRIYRKFQFKIVAVGFKLYPVNPTYIKCKRNK